MIETKTLLVCTFVLALILTGCEQRRDPESISVEEATEVLREAEAYTRTRDLEALCNMSGSPTMCNHQFHDAGGWAAVPDESPRIVDSYALPRMGQSVGGRILVLEGVDGLDRPYRTEYLIIDPGIYGLAPLHPIYWSGISIGPEDELLL